MQQYWIFMYIAAMIMMANGHVQDLRVSVSPVQSRFAAAQGVNVILKYSNTGSETMSIDKWYVPEKGQLLEPLFEITRDGKPVEYVGPLFKRRPPTSDEVITLAPGMTVTAAVQLSTVYNMTKTGNYVIQYKMDADQVIFTTDKALERRMMAFSGDEDYVLESAPIVLFAVGRRNLLVEQATEANNAQARALTPTYSSCSSSQSSAVSTAMPAAENYIANALGHLNAQVGSRRYSTWFGTYNSANHNKLKSHLTNIQNALKNQRISFDCSCPQGSSSTYAYVYANQPYKIYLCGAYWPSVALGTDSKAGTIIHELAHFTVLAGTKDHAYGQSSCRSLAISSPTNALANSDSLQYFVENNPTVN